MSINRINPFLASIFNSPDPYGPYIQQGVEIKLDNSKLGSTQQ